MEISDKVENKTPEIKEPTYYPSSNTALLLKIIGWILLIAGIFYAFALGFAEQGYYYTYREFLPSIFFTYLLGGIFLFAVCLALAKITNAADKYLNKG